MATTTSKRRTLKPPPPAEPEPDYLKLGDQLCFPVYLAARLVVNAYRPLLDELSLTYPQYLVMMVLWEHDGLNVGAIGEKLHLDTGTLTPLLKRMEKQQLVTRKRRGSDDRIVENWLTPEGVAMKQRAQQIPVQMLCNAHLDMEQFATIKSVVEGLVEKLLQIQPRESQLHRVATPAPPPPL